MTGVPHDSRTSGRVEVHGADGLAALVGQPIGPSSWLDVRQDRIDQFAAATGDHQWIHVDQRRAANGPFGGTIAHGYFTLSLTPVVLTEILEVRGFSLVVNYGCDRVRFPSPLHVGRRVRAHAVVDEVRGIAGGVQCAVTLTFETDAGGKPACVAEIQIRYYT